ncbi:MAG TPA: LPXTG cell wall anchor domain-containing protein [Mycobacteriales bacterium]|jgi:LPXTG-motif cell wall-anchored protein|nr:LPXTG cell wall anchor domain-containing protein [Mycobacteriales bacterium]
MPSIRKRRSVALGAFALASTTTLAAVAAASPAAAASTSHTAPAYYAGQAQGNALGLNIDLPVKLPLLPNPLSLNLIHLEGKTVHDPLHLAGNTTAISNATASLITGSLADTLQNTLHVNLNRTAHVALGGLTHQETSLLDIPAKPLADLSIGDLVANLVKSTNATNSGAHSIKANIASGNDLLGAQTVQQIQNLIDSTHLTDTLQGTVNQVLSTLQNVTKTTPIVGDAVTTVTNTVNAVLAKVTKLVDNLGTTPLVSISIHNTDQQVTPFASGVKSTSTMGLVDVDVLGGLLSIDGFHNSATAFANGKPGGAHAEVSGAQPLIKVNAADALCAQVGADGVSLCNVDGLGLPASITSQVNGLLKTLSNEINQITSKILSGVPLISETKGSTHVSEDGKSATATAPAYNISVGHLLTVTLGNGVSASAAALQNKPAEVTVLNNPENTPHSLPYTGSNYPLMGLLAMALLGIALVVRRRLMAH